MSRLPFLFLLCFLAALPGWPLAAEAPPDGALAAIESLAQAGAPQLALHQLDQEQPSFDTDPAAWMRWEQARIRILQAQGDWAGIVARAGAAPAEAAPAFRRWLDTQAARAHLALGQPQAARGLLRRLLWSAGEDEAQAFAVWRRLVIRSYLQEGRLADARSALLRYRQDYGEGDEAWRLLSGEVLLRSGDADAAWKVLDGLERPQAEPLRLLAGLRSGRLGAKAVLKRARKALDAENLPAALRASLWDVIAQTKAKVEDRPGRILALERALALSGGRPADALFSADAETLWTAWLDWGQAVGNEAQLLMGQDEAWYFAATEALEDRHPLRARVLFAVLGETTTDPHRRDLAHDYLAMLIEDLPHGGDLLLALYLDNPRFPDDPSIPAPIRHRLIDRLLARGDIPRAARLMKTLDRPPAGRDRLDWALRRARVQILAGEVEAGAAVLAGLLDRGEVPDGQALDRLMQVIFDLQKLGEHEQALALLGQVAQRELEPGKRRELAFWTAESEEALGHHARAARLYLFSATALDPFAMDPWAQTARYHAARALADAGFPADAMRQLRRLLAVTKDPARRAVLEHEIRRLQGSAVR